MEKNKVSVVMGAAMSVLGGAMWGISGTCGQFLFTRKEISCLWLTPIRLLVAGVILLLFCYGKYGKDIFEPWMKKQDRIDLLIYGLPGITLCQFLYFGTIQLSSAGVATILQDLSPIFILACGCIAAKRLPKIWEVMSIGLALIGVFLLVTHGNFEELAISTQALLVGCASALTVTLYNVYPKRILATYPILMLQGWSFFIGGSLSMLVFHPWTYHVQMDWQIMAGIAAVVVIGNVLAFNLYMTGVRLIGPQMAILYGFSEPVTAAIIAGVWLGTPFTGWDLAGFGCVFCMLILLGLPFLKKYDTMKKE